MWADDHRSTETLFAVVDALAAQGVIGDASTVIQEERPFFFSLFAHTRHSGLLSLHFFSLGFFEQRPNLGLPFFQLRNILSVEMPGAVDPAANLVDIPGNPADGCGQLFLLGVIHLDDVAIDRHFSEICAHVFGTELRHLALDEPPLLFGDAELDADRPCAFSHVGIRLLQTTTDISSGKLGTVQRIFLNIKIFLHFTTDSFGQKLGTCSEKISLSLYNGHFIRRLAGKAGIKFPSRKVPPNLQRTLFRLNAGMAAKYF